MLIKSISKQLGEVLIYAHSKLSNQDVLSLLAVGAGEFVFGTTNGDPEQAMAVLGLLNMSTVNATLSILSLRRQELAAQAAEHGAPPTSGTEQPA